MIDRVRAWRASHCLLSSRLVGGLTLSAALVLGCTANDDGTRADLGGSPPDPNAAPWCPPEDPAEAREPSVWTEAQAGSQQLDETNLIPLIDAEALPTTAPGFHLWDWWPVRDRDGQVARIDGWFVTIALSAPDDVLPGQRHDIARHRLLLSRDGRTWEDRGYVFPDQDVVLGSRQWAGSAMYDDTSGVLHVFYTASGRADWEEPPEQDQGAMGDDANGTSERRTPSSSYPATDGISFEQRLVLAKAFVDATDDDLRISAWGKHFVMVESGDDWYESTRDTEGGAGSIAGFRDPEYFRHPETGAEYVLFTANVAGSECDENGVVGIARAVPGTGLTEWEKLPPLLDANCVNQELERPHFVLHEGRYYLFFATHEFTYVDEITGYESLVGFVADEMFGDYRPLNGSGLVLANPLEEPFQSYSFHVLPNLLVTSFVDTYDLNGLDIDDVGDQPPEFQFDTFGGVFAPTIEIEIVDVDRTRFVRTHAPGAVLRDGASPDEVGGDDRLPPVLVADSLR